MERNNIRRNKSIYTIYGFIIALALSACGGPLSKSVTEPLTPEEAEEIAKKYDNFIGVYELIIFPRIDKLEKNSLSEQKMKKLTYGEFMKFYNLVYNNDWDEKISREWDKKYDDAKLTRQIDSKIDSLEKYWDNYIAENAPTTYVSFELIEIKKKVWKDPHWNDMKRLEASARVKVTPLRGKIDKLSANFILYRTDKTDPSKYTIGEHLGSGEIEIEKNFNAPVMAESELTISSSWLSSWYDYVCDTPVEVLKKKCKLHVSSPIVTVNGEEIDIMSLYEKKPSYITGYKDAKAKGDTSDSHYIRYREEFIQDCIDKDYAVKPDYIEKRKLQMLYEHNPLAFTLFYSEKLTNHFLMEWGK